RLQVPEEFRAHVPLAGGLAVDDLRIVRGRPLLERLRLLLARRQELDGVGERAQAHELKLCARAAARYLFGGALGEEHKLGRVREGRVRLARAIRGESRVNLLAPRRVEGR